MKKKVLFLDSRDRDFTLYPTCDRVGFNLHDNMRDVRKVTLLSFSMWFPPHPVGDQMNNVMLLLEGIRGDFCIETPAQMPEAPPGTCLLAVLQGLNTAAIGSDLPMLYQASPEYAPWKLEFPRGTNVQNLTFRLCYYDRTAAPGSILPITGFSWFVQQNEYSMESNWHCQLLFEYNN